MNHQHLFYSVLVMVIVTLMLRAIPFLIFSGKRQTPPFIQYLGKVLPYSIMAMLLIYCIRNAGWFQAPYGLPELIALAVTILLHAKKGNTLLSISAGTVVYMLLIQKVF